MKLAIKQYKNLPQVLNLREVKKGLKKLQPKQRPYRSLSKGTACQKKGEAMYTVAVKRDFIAQHYLIGGDWGLENHLHSHHYYIEVQLHGDHLDQHGYLVDIVDIESNLESLVDKYRDKTLNDLPSFEGLNPSIEHFSRILCQELSARIKAETLNSITIKLWENEIAWAAYQMDV
jgi:6-pyruvoyltetrahydropterin/6-carboxytetrahydropterin synthase